MASVVKNGSFEEGLVSWETNGSDAISVDDNVEDWKAPDSGYKRLGYYSDDPFKANTSQTLSGLENGNYILSAYVANSGTFNESYMYAENSDGKVTEDILKEGEWPLIELPVTVSNGEITIGFYADGQAGAWLGIDVVTLLKAEKATPAPEGFIKGVDISSLSKVEDHGGKFYDQGIEKDLIDILTSYGSNYARLKIWEDPIDADGYNDLDDTIRKAKRINDAGMKLLLNFHYSNFWADPGKQGKPRAWEDLSFEELVDAVYNHTQTTISALQAAGITPAMIQIGNEIRPGMLFPDGKIENDDFSNLAVLLNAGIQAVRDAEGGEDIEIMLHLDEGGDNNAYQWWFDGITEEGVTDYQVIGASYYPYWHGTLEDLQYNLNDISERYDKDVVVVETSYGFTLDDTDGHGNTFTEYEEGIAGYPATIEGQAKFLYDLVEVIKNVPNERGLGFFYWEPAWLGVEGAGWRAGEGNAWENQAMFDFDGNALESLNIFKDGYVPPEPEPRPEDPKQAEDPTLKNLVLHSLNKPATASSSAGAGGGKTHAPKNAVDGDEYTSWGTDEGIGAWWQVDLEKVSSLERILFNFWDGVKQVEIEVSDDNEIFTSLGLFDITESLTDIQLPEGTTGRYIKVTIIDATGNWVGFMKFEVYGTAEIEILDQTAPVTEININGELVNGNYIEQVDISLTAFDEGSGVDKIEYSFDGGSIWNTYTDQININEIGEHSIHYRSIDRADNIEAARSTNFSIQAKESEDFPTNSVKHEEQLTNNEKGIEEVEGAGLPATFSGVYNVLLGGVLLLVIGASLYFIKYRNRKSIS
jgi:arabinogalactan endo-1,4-beta-galactosidase